MKKLFEVVVEVSTYYNLFLELRMIAIITLTASMALLMLSMEEEGEKVFRC